MPSECRSYSQCGNIFRDLTGVHLHVIGGLLNTGFTIHSKIFNHRQIQRAYHFSTIKTVKVVKSGVYTYNTNEVLIFNTTCKLK